MKKFLHNEDGQAMVEFALVLPILIVVFCLIIDGGWLFYHKIAVNNACREGARYAAIHYREVGYTADVETAVNNALSISTPITVVSTEPGGTAVCVEVSTNVPVLTGLSATVFGSEVNMRASSTMRMEP